MLRQAAVGVAGTGALWLYATQLQNAAAQGEEQGAAAGSAPAPSSAPAPAPAPAPSAPPAVLPSPAPGGAALPAVPPAPAPASTAQPPRASTEGWPFYVVCVAGGIAVAAFIRGDLLLRLWGRVFGPQGPFGDIAAHGRAVRGAFAAEVTSGRAAAQCVRLALALVFARFVAQLTRSGRTPGERMGTLLEAAWALCGCLGWHRELGEMLGRL
eukprot:TRINITY_DN65962_c0_g1_i1.p2 TRINITY_DN65962_c0_g1~~TRINITY_DN65962_c0_g1_i1.p2  ORF type:complete len:245 (+),score=42.06 TRINITY_DN65962_c0_g1_i1:100-735(+)